MTFEIELNEHIVADLQWSFEQGPMQNSSGQRLLTEKEVGRFDGFVVHIFADEHPPPHFQVKYQNQSASFSILDCLRLRGNVGLERYEFNIRELHKKYRSDLIDQWNATRPTNCPVGPIIK